MTSNPVPTPPEPVLAEEVPRITAPRTWSPRARWMVPVGAATAVAAALAVPALVASASPDLPELTPAELLVKVAEAEPVAMSGTVVYTARLGLPDLPLSDIQGASPVDLLGGSSTIRVWTDGEDRSRAALLGSVSEYSVVRDGPEVWTYSSSDDEVVHYTIRPEDLEAYEGLEESAREGKAPEIAGDLPTPAAAADLLLAYAALTTDISVEDVTQVAGRDAYQLSLDPRTDGTLVDRILLAVDAETGLPLRVQVWSTQDTETPALEVGFTDVSFEAPDDSVFDFSAPPGASVKEVEIPLPDPDDAQHDDLAEDFGDLSDLGGLDGLPGGAALEGVSVTGTGWETVVELSGIDVAALLAGEVPDPADLPGLERTFGSEGAQELYEDFLREDGAHGIPDLDLAFLYEELTTEVPGGRLLSSALLSVLVTDDGRVLVGAVPAETLQELAG